MSRDHALAGLVEAGTGVLRFYRWIRPTISFGRNEPSEGLFDTEAAVRAGYDFVRRPTGGRAVLHDEELTYSAIVPVRALGGARKTCSLFGEALASGLRSLGAPAELVPDGGSVPPLTAGPCFAAPGPGEIVAEGRKLVGSAQARIGGALLQHGSIPIAGDQNALPFALGGRAVEGVGHTTLRTLIGEIDPGEAASALTRSFREKLGGSWCEGRFSQIELKRAGELRQGRYGSSAWTWRR